MPEPAILPESFRESARQDGICRAIPNILLWKNLSECVPVRERHVPVQLDGVVLPKVLNSPDDPTGSLIPLV